MSTKHTPGPWEASADCAEVSPTSGPKSHVELARKTMLRLLNADQLSYVSQADQDALGITRRDYETVRDAIRRATFAVNTGKLVDANVVNRRTKAEG